MNQFNDNTRMTRRAGLCAALLGMVLAMTGAANAAGAHKKHAGQLDLAVATEVAGITLPPGHYEVRPVKTRDGQAVEFVRQFRNELASELEQADQEEVVARVNITVRELGAAPRQTQLLVSPEAKTAEALKIRGDAEEYIFGQREMAAQ